MADEIKKDVTFEKEPASAMDEKQEKSGIPIYLENIELTEEQKKRLCEEIIEELDAIQKERDEKHLEEKWEALDNQYYGEIEEDTRLQFNLNRNITKPVVDRVANLIKQAFFKSDPKYSISPRPEFEREGGQEVCDKQQDFLDYKLDNLPFEAPEGKTIISSCIKGTGWTKLYHEIKREKRRREERYDGKPIPVGMDAQGKVVTENKGLKEFLANWPTAMKDYPGYVKDLVEGKEIKFIAEYYELTYNDPLLKNIAVKDLYVRLNTSGYEGMKDQRLIAERENYSYWKLKKEEKREKFYDIDKLVAEKDNPAQKVKNYASKDFDIFECNYFFKLKEEDEEEVKLKVWIAKEKKLVIGAVYYPLYGVECDYVPHYICQVDNGIYQPGLAEFVTDSNIAQSVILNLALGGAYIRNTVTPIVPEGSDVNNQFLEKRWTHGIPLNAKAGEIDFLQKYMSPVDIPGLLNLLQFMKYDAEEVTGSSSLMSGKEAPFDPSAPASKTIALLKYAGISIDEYINCISPSFNEIAYIMLQIYYQMSSEGRKYKLNPERVVGMNPFAVISRQELVARTNIQAQAYAFDFDKLNAKKEDVSLFSIIRNEPLVARNPEAVYFVLKSLISNWSPKWKNLIDKVLPPLAQLKQQIAQTTLGAVAGYMEQKLKEAQMTGTAPVLKPEELLPIVAELQAQIATPPPEEGK